MFRPVPRASAEETFPVGIATEGQGRQVQRRDPAFGALEQQFQLTLAQLQPLEIEEKRIALLARKSQVFRAQAEGPGLEGRLVDQEARAEAGRGHHPHVIGQVLDQVANPMRQGGVADAVEIVEEQGTRGLPGDAGRRGRHPGYPPAGTATSVPSRLAVLPPNAGTTRWMLASRSPGSDAAVRCRSRRRTAMPPPRPAPAGAGATGRGWCSCRSRPAR